MTKRLLAILLSTATMLPATQGQTMIFAPDVATLQVIANNDWLSPPVIQLGSSDVINIGFDQLSHNYQRYIYHIDHCEADWTLSQGIFESDFLAGFNDGTIDNYQNSIGTTVPYTHYSLQIPNDQCQIKLSGNYRLTVLLDQHPQSIPILQAEFMVVEPKVNVGLEISANTDIDIRDSHQQLTLKVNYGSLRITNPDEQLLAVVTQNGCRKSARHGMRANIRHSNGLEWTHCRDLIFAAGNEYRKFEVLALSHPTMGIESMSWDGQAYHAYTYLAEPRINYIYDEDANGAFYIRNSDNIQNDITTDYVLVHYQLKAPFVPHAQMMVNGWWTCQQDSSLYAMDYNHSTLTYHTTIMQKQGYYSYRYALLQPNGTLDVAPSEGSYYQTENKYQAYIYYKGTGQRTWQLVGYRQAAFRSHL